jgi:hypothetical protein
VLQISTAQVPIEIDLWDWLELQAGGFGIALEQARRMGVTAGLPPIVEAVGYYGPDDQRQACRVLCLADAGRVFVLFAMTPMSRYTEQMQTMGVILHSFMLLNARGPGQLEPWAKFTGETSPRFLLAYPQSWKADVAPMAPLPGKSFVDIKLATPQGELAGYVRVKAIDTRQHPVDQSILKTAAEEITETPVQMAGGWQEQPDRTMVSAGAQSYLAAATLGGKPITLQLLLAQRGPVFFAFTLLSPSREQELSLFLRCRRVVTLALETLSVEPV